MLHLAEVGGTAARAERTARRIVREARRDIKRFRLMAKITSEPPRCQSCLTLDYSARLPYWCEACGVWNALEERLPVEPPPPEPALSKQFCKHQAGSWDDPYVGDTWCAQCASEGVTPI